MGLEGRRGGAADRPLEEEVFDGAARLGLGLGALLDDVPNLFAHALCQSHPVIT